MGVKTGLDVWAAHGFRTLRGRRVGAILNPTTVDGRFQHLADLLLQRLDALTDRRRSDVQTLSGRIKAAQFHHRGQSSELRTVKLFLKHVAHSPSPAI